jgi:hypothetical protein
LHGINFDFSLKFDETSKIKELDGDALPKRRGKNPPWVLIP